MRDDDFARRVSGVGALAEPVRRALYRHVVEADGPVSRHGAATALGVPPHVARFHLDRLVEEGLLTVEYRRTTGRTGPGAGRPAKLYRRAPAEVAVSLPERRYDLAGELMAAAIETSAARGTPVADELAAVAAARGRRIAEAAGLPDATDVVGALRDVLAAWGYEPRVRPRPDGGADVTLVNCPFHALAREHTDLVCGMNLTLLEALVGGAVGADVRARLDPAPDRCCVVLSVDAAAVSSGGTRGHPAAS